MALLRYRATSTHSTGVHKPPRMRPSQTNASHLFKQPRRSTRCANNPLNSYRLPQLRVVQWVLADAGLSTLRIDVRSHPCSERWPLRSPPRSTSELKRRGTIVAPPTGVNRAGSDTRRPSGSSTNRWISIIPLERPRHSSTYLEFGGRESGVGESRSGDRASLWAIGRPFRLECGEPTRDPVPGSSTVPRGLKLCPLFTAIEPLISTER